MKRIVEITYRKLGFILSHIILDTKKNEKVWTIFWRLLKRHDIYDKCAEQIGMCRHLLIKTSLTTCSYNIQTSEYARNPIAFRYSPLWTFACSIMNLAEFFRRLPYRFQGKLVWWCLKKQVNLFLPDSLSKITSSVSFSAI